MQPTFQTPQGILGICCINSTRLLAAQTCRHTVRISSARQLRLLSIRHTHTHTQATSIGTWWWEAAGFCLANSDETGVQRCLNLLSLFRRSGSPGFGIPLPVKHSSTSPPTKATIPSLPIGSQTDKEAALDSKQQAGTASRDFVAISGFCQPVRKSLLLHAIDASHSRRLVTLPRMSLEFTPVASYMPG